MSCSYTALVYGIVVYPFTMTTTALSMHAYRQGFYILARVRNRGLRQLCLNNDARTN